jgi:hypothetical protein
VVNIYVRCVLKRILIKRYLVVLSLNLCILSLFLDKTHIRIDTSILCGKGENLTLLFVDTSHLELGFILVSVNVEIQYMQQILSVDLVFSTH